MLVCGREYHFPIDYESRFHITFGTSDKDVKSFAEELCTLLPKCRDVYKHLIAEHRAFHREYRISQLSNTRKFALNDIVFTNVQVQSNTKRGKVGKLSYTKRGPYEIIQVLPGGSYKLKLQRTGNIIKKHGSDLILSPKFIKPFEPLKGPDQAFGDIDKKKVDNPFEVIRIEKYNPVQPWKQTARAASSQLIFKDDEKIEKFPTVAQLDDTMIDSCSWPEPGINPFSPSIEVVECIKDNINDENDHLINTKPQPKEKVMCFPVIKINTIIANILQATDKLFFVRYQLPNEKRGEWKLVQVVFKLSVKKRPSCLNDGKFLVDFYICHPHDIKLQSEQQRFWKEYHRQVNHRTLGDDYHLIQPSQLSAEQARVKGLMPYREWFDFSNVNNVIHGPFEFASRNNTKSLDRVSNDDWAILATQRDKYDNEPPTVSTSQTIVTHWNMPIFHSERKTCISHRISKFHETLHNDDMMLNDLHI